MNRAKYINRAKPLLSFFLLLAVLLLSSCLGMKTDIVLNSNGSGTVTLEYLVSKSLDALGKLDGNERWNTIPVGKADFERTLDRLPDMKLISFSAKEDEKNWMVSAKIEFKTIKALLAFFDASNMRSSFSGDANSGNLVLTLSEGMDTTDPYLKQLLANICESYSMSMSVTFPKEGSLQMTDAQGKPLSAIPEGKVISKGKKVSFTFPVYDILTSQEGINAGLKW